MVVVVVAGGGGGGGVGGGGGDGTHKLFGNTTFNVLELKS